MKVLVLRNVVASGIALEAGQIYDISDKDATLLKGMGKATDAPIETTPKKTTAKRKSNGTK